MKKCSIPKTPTLFLHMGPGLHAKTEKIILGSQFTNIHYWDQPLVTPAENQTQGFSVLVNSAIAEIQKLSSKHRSPIVILAHSFGGHLVRPMLEAAGDQIASCHLVSTGFDLPSGFLKLLKAMHDAPDTDEGLREKLKQFIMRDFTTYESRMGSFWEMVNLVARDPSYVRHYWPNKDQLQKYTRIASSTPALDFTTFQSVVNDFLNNWFPNIEPYNGTVPIQVYLGGADPLLTIENEINSWKRVYPSCHISVLPDSGHFIHLEEYL